tara:strand:+ start:323 stop:658 length:336 start_codon:yes stop_codon:yes gene_type:complete
VVVCKLNSQKKGNEMAKSFVEVPQDAVRIRVGDNTELVAWQSEYNGVKQISFGKSTQYKEDGDVFTKMAPPITATTWAKLAVLANGHLFNDSSEVALAIDEAMEAPRRGAR